jgi:hypothetical protein
MSIEHSERLEEYARQVVNKIARDTRTAAHETINIRLKNERSSIFIDLPDDQADYNDRYIRHHLISKIKALRAKLGLDNEEDGFDRPLRDDDPRYDQELFPTSGTGSEKGTVRTVVEHSIYLFDEYLRLLILPSIEQTELNQRLNRLTAPPEKAIAISSDVPTSHEPSGQPPQ